MSLSTILAIGSGGFIGAVLRAYINTLFSKTALEIPLGTLSVNILGSFIMGVFFAFSAFNSIFSVNVKSFISTGLLGALTTYSTFAFESFLLFQGGNVGYALLNMALNLFGSIISAGIGYRLVYAIY